MKILCVSDTIVPQLENAVNLRRRYADIDLIVSCGDLVVLSVPLFYVRGNHDEMYSEEPPGGTDLHGKVVEYRGLTFAGLEGSIRYNEGKIQYNELEMAQMVIGWWPRMLFSRWRRGYGVDMLVTHSPAKGIHDGEDRPHWGFRSLRWFMRWYRPRYMVHGHVHSIDNRVKTRTDFYSTHVININPYTVLNVEPAGATEGTRQDVEAGH